VQSQSLQSQTNKGIETYDFPLIRVKLYNIYRNVNEGDLNVDIPVKFQRRHGVHQPIYNKPIIAKGGLDIEWYPGNHFVTGVTSSDIGVIGAHWSNADPCFCVNRRVKNRRDRQSKYNLQHGLTIHHHYITEEDVLKECEDHYYDPMVF
jgi:hypothetical protein